MGENGDGHKLLFRTGRKKKKKKNNHSGRCFDCSAACSAPHNFDPTTGKVEHAVRHGRAQLGNRFCAILLCC
jgi:hypothetical protein